MIAGTHWYAVSVQMPVGQIVERGNAVVLIGAVLESVCDGVTVVKQVS